MTVPTRIIDDEEFAEIVRVNAVYAGDALMLFELMALTYGENAVGELTMKYDKPLYLLYVNIVEPLIFKDKSNERVVLLVNAYLDWDYDEVKDLHFNQTADLYIIAPWGWRLGDIDHELDDAEFFFRSDTIELGKVDIENPLPVTERRSH